MNTEQTVDVDSMEAGREMDALVAQKVARLKEVRPAEWRKGEWIYTYNETPFETHWAPVPYYSTDIAAAWQVVEEITDMLHPASYTFIELWEAQSMWACTASEAALAICRIALKASE